jgi:hypothetical protein
MHGSQHASENDGGDRTADDTHVVAEKIDVARFLDEMERVLRAGTAVGMRNELLAILRRWQFDTMLTEYSCERAARLLREFTQTGSLQKV